MLIAKVEEYKPVNNPDLCVVHCPPVFLLFQMSARPTILKEENMIQADKIFALNLYLCLRSLYREFPNFNSKIFKKIVIEINRMICTALNL